MSASSSGSMPAAPWPSLGPQTCLDQAGARAAGAAEPSAPGQLRAVPGGASARLVRLVRPFFSCGFRALPAALAGAFFPSPCGIWRSVHRSQRRRQRAISQVQRGEQHSSEQSTAERAKKDVSACLCAVPRCVLMRLDFASVPSDSAAFPLSSAKALSAALSLSFRLLPARFSALLSLSLSLPTQRCPLCSLPSASQLLSLPTQRCPP